MNCAVFLTPMLPCPTGRGSAMRASVAVDVLAERYRVIVVYVELWGRPDAFSPEDWVRERSAAYIRLGIMEQHGIRAAVAEALARLGPDTRIEAIYAFRMAVAHAALSCLQLCAGPPPTLILDLDDDEKLRAERAAPLHEAAGQGEIAERIKAEAGQMAKFRQMIMPRFQVNFLANPEDCRAFSRLYPALRFAHLPNVVPIPEPPPARNPDPHSLLFLGSLDYLPNEDGVTTFCRSILPLIRQSDPRMCLRIAGAGYSAPVLAVTTLPGVTLVGSVPRVDPEYERAAMLVVPLRAGSGTRIKILEAFSFGCPVVSTAVGAEGLGVRDGEQLLIADSPEDFAAACLRLAGDEALRHRLVRSARAWLLENHSVDRARTVIFEWLEGARGGLARNSAAR